jgi:uncharacterized protein YkwD
MLERRQFIFGVAALGVAGCLPSWALAARAKGGVVLSEGDFDAALLAGINAERAARGLRPFGSDPRLADAARHGAMLMATARLMQHEIAGTPGFPARLRAARARIRTAGENILRDNVSRYGLGCSAGSSDIARRLSSEVARVSVPRWIGSPKHFTNITSQRFNRAGASFAVVLSEPGCGQIYVAQVFGG